MDAELLGGRSFQIITNGPVKHDFYMFDLVRKAGMSDLRVPQDSTPDVFANNVIDRAIASGQAIPLLAGMLLPDGMPITQWTPAVAADVEAHVNALIEPEDKSKVRQLLAMVLIGFFQIGLVSLTTSPTSSMPGGEAPTESEPDETDGL